MCGELEKKKVSTPPNIPKTLDINPPFPSRLTKAKKEESEKEILDTFQKVEINIPLLEAIRQLPKYARFLKGLCTNRNKLNLQDKVRVGENVSAVLQIKLPQKCKDPSMFTIPCIIGQKRIKKGMLDLGASINVMPLSIFKALNLGPLKDTNVVIQLADRSNVYPEGVVEDVLVKVNEFIFPADFYIVDMNDDNSVNSVVLLLGRPFMSTARTKIDVHEGTLSVEFDGETITFNIFYEMKYPKDTESVNYVAVSNSIVQEHLEQNLMEDKLEFVLQQSKMNADVESEDEEDTIEAIMSLHSLPALSDRSVDSFLPLPTSNERILSSVEQAPDLELKELPKHLKYVYLGDRNTLPVIIANDLTVLLWVLSNHCYPRGPAQKPLSLARLALLLTAVCLLGYVMLEEHFKKCMMSIFSDMIENCIEIFMDDFTIYGGSFDQCLHHLTKVIQRCIEINLILNYEKCHFMVKEGIVLGHVISTWGIEVDKAKVDLTTSSPYPTNVKEIHSFLGHASFYRRFIKDFSRIAQPLSQLFQKEATFDFEKACKVSFDTLKSMLTIAPIIQPPDWSLPFELMCDASQYAVGVVLGQRSGKCSHVIYYASKTLSPAQYNYTTTDKELLAIIFAFEKFRSCDKCQNFGSLSHRDEMPQIEAKATRTNDSRVVAGFLKSHIFSRFGVPRAIISDQGTHFCNHTIEALMHKYGVHHRVGITYHPQTNKQAEVSNHEIKMIEYRAFWAVKQCNLNADRDGKKRKIQLQKLEEIRLEAYDNAQLYK
ncbi:uncharacterized protein [Coffea arabica]|uniref:Integrase catalytic domain-containing protein n=1 Tax=Coffea arabica TaxID=13443 RepID=A0A6P6S8C4_COFAR|nr:uncharacterized protein LOC113688449 [Coffea arabica]